MGTFDLKFQARSTTANPEAIRARAEELDTLQSRLMGRADDLNADFNSSATQFTDLIGWNIKDDADEDHQQWKDAGVAIVYAASQLEVWAQHVEDFKTERSDQTTEWFDFRTAREDEIPGKYKGSTITDCYPVREGLPFSAERKCRDLFDDVADKLADLEEREHTNYKSFEENAEKIADKLREGPTKENVQDLIDADVNSWAFYNLDPNRYTMLVDGQELTSENAQEWSRELEGYWSGEKPLDDRYHQLMIMMSMIGSNAMQAQQGGTGYRSEEIDFLQEFYDTLEGEDPNSAGVLGIPEQMEDSNLTGEDREHALGMLGNGILALSDEDLGGSYEDLPLSVRRAVEGPQFYEPGDDEVPYSWPLYANDAPALADMFRHTNEDLQGGYELSVNLSMSTGTYTHGIDESDLLASEDLAPLVDVGARNEDANYYVLTGEHPTTDPYAGHPALGTDDSEPGVDHSALDVNFTDEERTNVVEGLFTYEWHDNGEAASGLIDWISGASLSEDQEVKDMAGEAASSFVEMVTTEEMQEALTDTGVTVGESKDASFSEFNTVIADKFADVFDSYLFSFAASEVKSHDGNETLTGVTDYNPGTGAFNIGVQERATYMQYLMGNEETAIRTINSATAYENAEIELYLATGDNDLTAPGAASLFSLIDLGLEMEMEDRTGDLEAAQARKEDLYTFALEQGGNQAEKIPIFGSAINQGLDLGADAIVQQLVETDIDVVPRVPRNEDEEIRRINQQAVFLNHVMSSDNDTIVSDPDEKHIKVLEEYGALTYEADGSVTVESNPDKWDVVDEPGGGRRDVANALHGALNSTEIAPSNREQADGNTFYNEFSTPYNTHYDTIQDEVNGKEK